MSLQSGCTQYGSSTVITGAFYSTHWLLLGSSFPWTWGAIPSIYQTQGARLRSQSVSRSLELLVCGTTVGCLHPWGTPLCRGGLSMDWAWCRGLTGAWRRRLRGRVRSVRSCHRGGGKNRRSIFTRNWNSRWSRDSFWSWRSISGWRRRSGRQIPLIEGEDQAHGFLFELSEVSGTDITATVPLVPRPPRAVGHLKLVVEQEWEGGILGGEKKTRRLD